MVIDQALNRQILLKLLIAAVMMFGFGYALVPMYKALCEVTGINVVTSKNDYGVRAFSPNKVGNTQVNYARTVTIEFDSNSRGPFTFKPVKNFLEVHPGEMTEIVYEGQTFYYVSAENENRILKLKCFSDGEVIVEKKIRK